MSYRIHQAIPEDAEAVVGMHGTAHQESYQRLMPDVTFHAVGAELAERINRRRSFLDSAYPRLVALDDNDAVVGFADSGPGRDEEKPCGMELYRIYTLARTYGTGLGSDLLRRCIGDAAAYLWVLEQNPRAQAFYSKHGFRPDGGRKRLPAAFNSLPEIRMVRPALIAPPAQQHAK